MKIGYATIIDTFAEAWDLEVMRVLLTALTPEVALGGAEQFAGAAGSSMIGSRVNAGIERFALPHETPDGRPGVYVSMAMGPSARQDMLKEVELRVALASLIPTVAVWDAMVPGVPTVPADLHGMFKMSEERWKGYDTERVVGGRTLCVVPTTTGEFAYEKVLHISTAGTDGHFVCFAENAVSAVASVTAAKKALEAVDGASPMGYGLEQVFREYDYIPSLRQKIKDSKVPEGCNSILNLLMFGASPELMRKAMTVSLRAAAQVPGVLSLSAMNFGGTFGRHKYPLHELLK
jgi:formylmethanofuran--tetrahydromethanopterin N-formyltransferase